MKKLIVALLLALFLVMPFQAKAQAIENEQVIIYIKAQISIILQLIQLLQAQLAIIQAQEAQSVGTTPIAEPPQIVQNEPVQQLITQSQTMPTPTPQPTPQPIPQPTPTPVPQGLTPEEKEKLKKEKSDKEVIFKEVKQSQIDGCALDRKKQLIEYGFFNYWHKGQAEAKLFTNEQIDSYVSQNPQDANFAQSLYLECITPESTRHKTPEQMEARNRIFEIDRKLSE